jgi:hypothetical protein
MQKKHIAVGAAAVVIAGVAASVGLRSNSGSVGSEVVLDNQTDKATHVFVSFGADSVVKAADWASFCTVRAPLNCDFQLGAKSIQLVTGRGRYLNATISFDGQGCGATKAELNVSNPNWYNVLDVSLVDGYSNKVKITNTELSGKVTTLGPPAGKTGNENIMGVFPYGCDICVAQQHPPCGIVPGGPGCHSGTQYAPVPVCQWQGPKMGPIEDSKIVVSLVN